MGHCGWSVYLGLLSLDGRAGCSTSRCWGQLPKGAWSRMLGFSGRSLCPGGSSVKVVGLAGYSSAGVVWPAGVLDWTWPSAAGRGRVRSSTSGGGEAVQTLCCWKRWRMQSALLVEGPALLDNVGRAAR